MKTLESYSPHTLDGDRKLKSFMHEGYATEKGVSFLLIHAKAYFKSFCLSYIVSYVIFSIGEIWNNAFHIDLPLLLALIESSWKSVVNRIYCDAPLFFTHWFVLLFFSQTHAMLFICILIWHGVLFLGVLFMFSINFTKK